MNKKKSIYIFSTSLLLIVIIGFFTNKLYSDVHKEIDTYKGETEGIIVKYGISGKTIVKSFRYEFSLDGQKYQEATTCEDNTYLEKLCSKQGYPNVVGATFTVEYSTLNPDKNRIVIGKHKCLRNFKVQGSKID